MKLELGAKVLSLSKPWGHPGTVVRVDGNRASVAWPEGGVKLHDTATLVGAANRPELSKRPKLRAVHHE